MESILNSIKTLLGVEEDYEEFDKEIITHINSSLATLNQLGVGPEDGFEITDSSSLWQDFIENNKLLINPTKMYVYYSVRLGWDPPTSATHIESMKNELNKTEFRIRSMVDWGA